MANDYLSKVEKRIKELGEKSSQTLLFLSFALVVVATLKGNSDPAHQVALKQAMYWWSLALFPILVSILPLKEIFKEKAWWYEVVRYFKIVLLWVAIGIIGLGALEFTKAVQQVFSN